MIFKAGGWTSHVWAMFSLASMSDLFGCAEMVRGKKCAAERNIGT